MNKLPLVVIILAFLISCGDENYGPIGGGSDPGPYTIESEPSLSPDKNFVYYIANDTITYLYSGIYRLDIGVPKREKILYGHTYHSPSVNFDNKLVAYLDANIINYYNFSLDSHYVLDSSSYYESIFYVSNDVLLGNRFDSIFVIDETGFSYFLLEGRDPTYVAPDSFVYLSGEDSVFSILLKNVVLPNLPETLVTISTGTALPRWPSLHSVSGRLAYGIEFSQQKFIYTIGQSDTGFVFVDSSDYSKPLLLRENLLIFTGPDGRFYQSDAHGNKTVPFIDIGRE